MAQRFKVVYALIMRKKTPPRVSVAQTMHEASRSNKGQSCYKALGDANKL